MGWAPGISIYEGVQELLHPHPISNPLVNYAVLAAAGIFEGAAWWVAYREFGKVRGNFGLFEAVRRSKDPTIFTVLFEDSAAMVGLLVAAIGIVAATHMELAWADGAASVAIGLILAGTAMLLAYETKGLLIGEAASRSVTDGVRLIASRSDDVLNINELRTMHLAPNDVLLALSLDFRDDVRAGRVEHTIQRMEQQIKP